MPMKRKSCGISTSISCLDCGENLFCYSDEALDKLREKEFIKEQRARYCRKNNFYLCAFCFPQHILEDFMYNHINENDDGWYILHHIIEGFCKVCPYSKYFANRVFKRLIMNSTMIIWRTCAIC